MIRHVAVVPSTPLVLADWPGDRHAEVAEVARAATRVLEGIDAADVVIVLAGGPVLCVHDLSQPEAVDVTAFGASLPPHRLASPPAGAIEGLEAAIGGIAPAEMCTNRPMAGHVHISEGGGRTPPAPDLRVLGRLLPAGTPAVGVGVPASIDPLDAAGVADVILDLADDSTVAVVAAGDLGAGHGEKPPRPAAALASAMLDDLVVAALDNGRPRDLLRLDAELVAASASRGAGALRVLGAVLDQARVATVVRTVRAPLGVGYVVAQGG